jgi:hypothetical protein
MSSTAMRSRSRLSFVGLAAIAVAACGGRDPVLEDPVPGVPQRQQRSITRSELGFRWPFTVGAGTIACDGGALAFRSGGTTYALSRGAGTRGYEDIDAIRRTQGSGPPSDPVSRLTQTVRMELFAKSSACGTGAGGAAGLGAAECKARIRKAGGLSESELTRIEAEGLERYWPPARPPLMGLEAVLQAAHQLCPQ